MTGSNRRRVPVAQVCVAIAVLLAANLRLAHAADSSLPTIDERKAAAAGIRSLVGKHITIYTDVPDSDEVRELPAVFDAAVPKLAEYFELDPKQVAAWKVIGYLMQDKDRFVGAGLYPAALPEFPNGFALDGQIWWYEQPSAYYRRHLMLHEGTHAFMNRWLGGSGPPWYSEGMAELLGTHRWEQGKLQLAYTPQKTDEVPYWGRVKIVQDAVAAGKELSLVDVMKFDARAHLRNEPYGWCWAATEFLEHHPLAHDAFRKLKSDSKDRSLEFSRRFVASLKSDWPLLADDWRQFVQNMDYGYDVQRAAIVRKQASPLPAKGASATVLADRGWQSTGFRVEAGKTYAIAGSGRFELAGEPQPWPCEANGITLHYYHGRPLGELQAGLGEVAADSEHRGLLAEPTTIGLRGEFTPAASGVLYLRVNESPASLANNSGTLKATIALK